MLAPNPTVQYYPATPPPKKSDSAMKIVSSHNSQMTLSHSVCQKEKRKQKLRVRFYHRKLNALNAVMAEERKRRVTPDKSYHLSQTRTHRDHADAWP